MSDNNTVKIPIHTEYIKLDSLLKLCCAAPDGAAAKHMVASGGVKVNGETCLMRGKKLYPGDIVESGGMLYEVTEDKA